MTRIACPYCCEVQTFSGTNECRRCASQVPENYILAGREVPPVYLAAVGFSQHGKTTFIQNLAVTLEEMDKVSDSYLEYMDDFTANSIKSIRSVVGTQKINESTRAVSNRETLLNPLVFSIAHFHRPGKAPVVIYDLAGESFNDQSQIEQYADPLKLAHTIWFFVSLHDLGHENQEYATILDLFNVYMAGMQRVGAITEGRNLHVIYTKADKLTNILPQSIRNYLRNDPYADIRKKLPRELADAEFKPDVYSEQVEKMSAELEAFTQDEVSRGRAFVRRVEDSKMTLSFSITSSTGREATRDNTILESRSFRVIDPLLWALNNNREIGGTTGGVASAKGKEIALIMDASYGCEPIYQNKMPGNFFAALMEMGEVKSYYLGTDEPITDVGREPDGKMPTQYRGTIIGPILDKLSDEALVLVITRQAVLDLADFDTPEWHHRLGFVTFTDSKAWALSARFDHLSDVQTQAKEIVARFFKKKL